MVATTFSRRWLTSTQILIAFLTVAFLSNLASPPLHAAICSRGNIPAATLLIPYFEVDIAAPGGRTTLFSIGNAGQEPTIAQVTLWTDWGVPVLGFFVHVGPEGVETINLRDVIGHLQVPSLASADLERFPGCATAQQIVGASAEQLQARLTGRPDPVTEACFGRDRGDTTVAVGFVTVDVADDCVSDLATPGDWILDSLAGSANVLWGDIFYVDPDDDSAQGLNAVPIRDDPAAIGGRSFYPNDLSRVPTDETWRTRYITGAGVDAETELTVWIWSWTGLYFPSGDECGSTSMTDFLHYRVRSGPQAGPLEGELDGFQGLLSAQAMTRRLTLDELLSEERPENGVLEVEGWDACIPCVILPPEPVRLPSFVWPTFRASGRFSLTLEATPTNGPCSDMLPEEPGSVAQ